MKQKWGGGERPRKGGIQTQGCVPEVTVLGNSPLASPGPPEKCTEPPRIVLFIHWPLSPATAVAPRDLGCAGEQAR